jgi:Tol biopolymer transport system component
MGEVYRARDTKLDRHVAIKVLPESFSHDAERIARFQREAKTLASLNHPNIGGIHGLEEANGITALVLELVEGPTLADRIAGGPIPLDEALPIAKQIAEALEAAHEQGIIHRDLKPANIKVRPDGTVKVLDFGLAKLVAAETDGALQPDLSQSPTLAHRGTMAGMILGTAAYMSPEQARGKPVDKRTDIWAFGCVLYEMLTGRRTFAGDEVSDVLASLLTREPDLAALPATTPSSIRQLLRRCLQKDRNERLRDIGEARIATRDALAKADPEATGVAVPGADRHGRERLAWIGVLSALTLALAASVLLIRRSPVASEMRVEITTPPTTEPRSLAISPDGRTIAFVATAEGQSRLWLRSLESGSVRIVAGTDGAQFPFWSPDSRSVGFFAESKLKRVDVDGGSVQSLANAPLGRGGTWNRDDVILFASLGRPIFRIPATGGEPVALSRLAQQGSDFSPQFLPDGRRFLYYVRGSPEVRGVYVGQLDAALDARRLLDSDTSALFAASGQLLFVRQGTLYAQGFDPIRLALTAGPFPVAERVASQVGVAALSVSASGPIIYRTGSTAEQQGQWVWFDRSGRKVGRASDAMADGAAGNAPSMSLDGRSVALQASANGNPDIWTLETGRGVFSRLTFDAADDVMPMWSPDGGRIVFSSNRTGVQQLYQKSVTGAGAEGLLISTAQHVFANDWSLDGRFLLYQSANQRTGTDLWALPMNGDGKPFAVVQTNFNEEQAQFSPDSKWIAYQSNETGRFEIYVQPFPGPGGKSLISTNGGGQVRWRRDGKELYYVALDGRLMAIPVRPTSSDHAVDAGTPVPLFATPMSGAPDERQQYVVSSDGQRFLMKTVTEAAGTSPITVILNWKPRP